MTILLCVDMITGMLWLAAAIRTKAEARQAGSIGETRRHKDRYWNGGRLHEERLLLVLAARIGLLLVVNVEADLLAGVDAQSLLEHLANPGDAVRLAGVS